MITKKIGDHKQMQDLDFVITWLDDSDPVWSSEKALYSNERGLNNDSRFRDWGLLKYWFRAVEQYAPWVRMIHFVTYGHVPDWLDISNPKLHVVNHRDFIPAQYLPTFNSHTIELNLHRIDGLAEHFVYFNDDVFITKPVSPEFFFERGLPKDIFALFILHFNLDDNNAQTYVNDIMVINSFFDAREVYKQHWKKLLSPKNGIRRSIKTFLIWTICNRFFPAFYNPHVHFPFLKSTFGDVWAKAGDVLDETCMCRFRTPQNNVGPTLIRDWQYASGTFIPRPGRYTRAIPMKDDRIPAAVDAIENHSYNILCLNDNAHLQSVDKAMSEIRKAFELILPEKCSFEK